MNGKDKIEFEVLKAKLVGSNAVIFNLSDGAQVKIVVDIGRVGVAKNFKNPDGTPHYNIQTALRLDIIPSKKRYFIPRSMLRAPTAKKESDMKPI